MEEKLINFYNKMVNIFNHYPYIIKKENHYTFSDFSIDNVVEEDIKNNLHKMFLENKIRFIMYVDSFLEHKLIKYIESLLLYDDVSPLTYHNAKRIIKICKEQNIKIYDLIKKFL
jgi:hypothetical protein